MKWRGVRTASAAPGLASVGSRRAEGWPGGSRRTLGEGVEDDGRHGGARGDDMGLVSAYWYVPTREGSIDSESPLSSEAPIG